MASTATRRRAGARRSQDYREGMTRGWFHGGHLPHFDGMENTQHVTWHLADSVPVAARARVERQIAALAEEDRDRERRERYQALLDNGYGDCVLRRPEVAAMVVDSLRCFDGTRYRLHAWVVMPNHVHVLAGIAPEADLAVIVQSWKSYTARRINIVRGRQGQVWHRDYWDRWIRTEAHFAAAVAYIEQNPVKAGLVRQAADWRWSHLGPTSSSSSA